MFPFRILRRQKTSKKTKKAESLKKNKTGGESQMAEKPKSLFHKKC